MLQASRMNVFAAEHPLASQQGPPHTQLRRWLLRSLFIYPLWLLLLGPFWALDGRGAIEFLPLGLRRIVYSPAAPLFYSRSLSPIFESYMNWWHEDPNPPETTE